MPKKNRKMAERSRLQKIIDPQILLAAEHGLEMPVAAALRLTRENEPENLLRQAAGRICAFANGSCLCRERKNTKLCSNVERLALEIGQAVLADAQLQIPGKRV